MQPIARAKRQKDGIPAHLRMRWGSGSYLILLEPQLQRRLRSNVHPIIEKKGFRKLERVEGGAMSNVKKVRMT